MCSNARSLEAPLVHAHRHCGAYFASISRALLGSCRSRNVCSESSLTSRKGGLVQTEDQFVQLTRFVESDPLRNGLMIYAGYHVFLCYSIQFFELPASKG